MHQDANTTLDSGSIEKSVEKCVKVAVPTATATVNAKLKVSANGVKSESRSSTKVSTGDHGTLKVCVEADAAAELAVNADVVADAGLRGATVNVAAEAVAQPSVHVNVSVNGQGVL